MVAASGVALTVVRDGGSGDDTLIGTVADGETIDTRSVGTKTFTVTSEDNAGNQVSSYHSYNVLYDFAGFFQPVDNLPTFNSLKAGAAVPVKFSLSGDQGPGIFSEGYPKSQQVSCDSTTPLDNIEQTVSAGGSSLTYDATLDRYTYVWKTNQTWAESCRQLIVQLEDGAYQRANFKFK